MVVGIPEKDFQNEAVIKLIDLTSRKDSKQVILVKSPTGSGKTIILIDYIDEYLRNVNQNTAFVWLCPGKGNLEEQSMNKMQKFCPGRVAQSLFGALSDGFTAESTTFINWELVTKTGNTALSPTEKKNLFDRIAEAHRQGIEFIVVVDEEHANNTAKANAIINLFSAKHIIRMSATAVHNNRYEWYEIDELDVINEGLITKAIYVNEGISDNAHIDNDYDYLIELADKKRIEISNRYNALEKDINPLVLIQFPSAQPATIKAVEDKLESLGYTYDNGMVSKWLSEDKRDLPDNLTENNGRPVFLLMKQAISTGWDCPRAKILVKLREGMSETFEIQTIGRIRRMPEPLIGHYDDDLLDFSYVYTFDETYKNGLLSAFDRAYETKRLFLKDKCKTFTLEKQIRDKDFNGLGEREVLDKIFAYYHKKYKVGDDIQKNAQLLQSNGYKLLGNTIVHNVLQGEFVRTTAVMNNTDSYITTNSTVNTSDDGIRLLHCTDAIKSAIGMSTANVKAILERLFRNNNRSTKKILALTTSEFYAFVINNAHQLKVDFRSVTAEMSVQRTLLLNPKKQTFRIPEQDFFKYDPGVKDEIEYLSNAYQDYTSGFATSLVRSKSEMMFEQCCDERNDIDWVYKNGDTGQQYFSIVYIDGLQHQWLFYADYIIKKKDGTIWIIETKGGEYKGQSQNIDIQIENKFNAFKEYATDKNLSWGFVREKDNRLYINNTEFNIDMSDSHWVTLNSVF